MASTLLALFVVVAVFLAGIWATLFGLLTIVGFRPATWPATILTVVLLGVIGYAEYKQRDTIEALAGARPIDPDAESELERITTRIAAQLDVPKPTIAIADRHAPEAMAVGFRPSNIHLVISSGALDSLETTAELEAVVAHELAHVANRDAMVMTAVSAPVVLADGLLTRFERINDNEDNNAAFLSILTVPLGLLSLVVSFCGRCLTAHLSRERERAADRAAVGVTGSPAALATALERLDDEITATPTRDLRDAAAVSSLSILSLEPDEPEKIMLGPEGQQEPSYWWLRKRLYKLFRTHPPTPERLEWLADAERRQE
ncbi:M48 family metalloprotease [Natronolimnobius baerhuensis]|nr:M48 family metalloprotease [Natronolimnobius baerhuensis]